MTIRCRKSCLDESNSPLFTHLTIDEWQEQVEAHPDTIIFHHRHWIELLRDHYGVGVRIPAIRQNGHIRVAVPFVETRTLWGGKKLVSLPFTDCIRVLDSDENARGELAEALRSESGQGYKSTEIRTDKTLRPQSNGGLWVRSQLNLAAGLDEITRNFPSTLKRNLSKAKRHKLRFERGTDSAAMDEFYRLHVATRKKLGVPVQPRTFFRRLFVRIITQGLGFVGLVKKNDVAIASGVFLCWNKSMVYKYAASNPAATQYRPNELLVYETIRMAIEQGYSIYDFGVSQKSHEGLRRFKRKWGAVETDVYNECVTGKCQRPTCDSLALKIAAVAIRNSPQVVCRALGEVFYRYSQ